MDFESFGLSERVAAMQCEREQQSSRADANRADDARVERDEGAAVGPEEGLDSELVVGGRIGVQLSLPR